MSTKMNKILASPYKQSVATEDNLEKDDDMTAQLSVRSTPVLDSKYLPVWQRARAKLKARLMVKHVQQDIQLFGTNQICSDLEETHFGTPRKHKEVDSQLDTGVKAVFPRCLIHPNSRFKTMWSIVVMLLLVYTATVMPFRMAFIEPAIWSDWFIAELVIDFLFLIDVIVNCFSAYMDEDQKLITDRQAILFRYATGWMLLDIVACIPFGLIELGQSQDNNSSQGEGGSYKNFIRLLRVPRLYRLMRISRIFKALKINRHNSVIAKIQEFFALKQSAVRLGGVALTITIIAHIVACIWIFLAKLEGSDPDSWIVRAGYADDPDSTVYIASLYWAFTTMSTVGYGDISARTEGEQFFSLIIMVFGVCFFSYIIGNMASMLQRQDSREAVLNNKMAIIDEFAQESQLDPALKRKLRHALTYSTEKNGFSWSDKQHIFDELPRDLKYQVAMVMHKGACQEIGFFQNRDVVFVYTVVPFLQYHYTKQNQIIYNEDEYADLIYFIHRGRVNCVYRHKGETEMEMHVYKSFQRGSYFGDIEVIQGIARKYCVQSAWHSDLLTMSKQLFESIQDQFSGIAHQMRQVAEVRDKLNQKAIQLLIRQLNPIQKRSQTYKPTSTPIDQDELDKVSDPMMAERIDNVERDIKKLSKGMKSMQETLLQRMDEKFAKLTSILENQAPRVSETIVSVQPVASQFTSAQQSFDEDTENSRPVF